MENARLRAEVATQYAHEAARSLLAGDSSHLAASVQKSLQIGEPQVSREQPNCCVLYLPLMTGAAMRLCLTILILIERYSCAEMCWP